jgi:UDP-N-acetylmuramyl pentapeptide phosphotransferase/UDP-N-acetylglucosamine-1-phosphate transferase
MNWLIPAGAAIAAAPACWLATWLALILLRKRDILDHPNERSSHHRPTPRGGGIAIVAILGIGWLTAAFALQSDAARPGVLLIGALLALFSFVDDLRGLSVAIRLALQVLAVAAGVAMLPADQPIFQGMLPPWWDAIAAGLVWLWFVNLYNFMDGIDGIAGVETLAIAAGIAIIALLVPPLADLAVPAAVLAAAAAGFLVWNWQPARIFMGDVGSVGIGFLTGWLLLWLAGKGYWAPALILPLYFLADASVTLGRRLLRGEAVWRAHRSHFYQQAVIGGLTHARVSLLVAALNVALVAIAVYAVGDGAPVTALLLATAATASLLIYFRARKIRSDHGE